MSVAETTRELFARWEKLTSEEKKRAFAARRMAVRAYLQCHQLAPGDRIRATKSECGARESSYTVCRWVGDDIETLGGTRISPGMVYSLNGTPVSV